MNNHININDKTWEFIKNAYDSVPFYMNMVEEGKVNLEEKTLESLPLITKDEIMYNNSILSAQAIPLMYRNELMHMKTSGSTGRYLDIYWKKNDYAKSMMPLWILRKKYYGITPADKLCYFFTVKSLEDEQDVVCGKNEMGFSKSKLEMLDLKNVLEMMSEYEPKWLLLQPSIAMLLCECMDKYEIKSIDSIKYIEMSGEILTNEVRENVKKHFNCAIANQYGANEVNSIAYECPYGNMHIMESNVIVEIMDENEKAEEGEVYLTTLTNTAMPLIRYKIGDLARVKEIECKCGSKHKTLELTSGRTNDYIEFENGETITPYSFVRAIDIVNYKLDSIVKQFQIIQNDFDDFEISFVVDEDEMDMVEEIEEIFVESIKDERLKDAHYEFKYLSRMLPDEKSGKFKYFKRR